jgi:hypothetical protein
MADRYLVPGKGWVSEKTPEPPAPEHDDDELLGTPVVLNHHGEPTEFWPIGSLAAALNRSVVTLRKWERRGILPKATFGIPTQALGGRVRLYNRPQIMGLRRIAEEEGLLLDLAKSVTRTEFRKKARVLFGLEEDQ